MAMNAYVRQKENWIVELPAWFCRAGRGKERTVTFLDDPLSKSVHCELECHPAPNYETSGSCPVDCIWWAEWPAFQ